MTTIQTNTELHPFERAGLGTAPFRFIGMDVKRGPIQLADGSEVGSPGQPMGTCDYCGTGIADCYSVQSADGKRFIVGCDCVCKLARTSNEKRDPIIAAINREARKVKTARRHERESQRITEGKAWFEQHREQFTAMPHPVAWRAEQGETYADMFDWFMMNAGNAGKLRAIAEAKAKINA
jgi:hypothetical protein